MKNAIGLALFQVAWFAAVGGAARGDLWVGPLAVAALVVVHLLVQSDRLRELRYVIAVGVLGTLLDTLLHALGVTSYPGTRDAWSHVLVPPWISALWVAFATLPSTSLGWLAGRPRLAVLLGALGGPLSYFAGVRMGAVAVGHSPLVTWSVLAVEYALVTPLLVALAPRRSSAAAVALCPAEPRAPGPLVR